MTEEAGCKASPLTDQLGRAPWADDVEAWLEASSVEEIADDIDLYAMAEVARAVAAERERCAKVCETAPFTGNTFPVTQMEQLRRDIAAAILRPNAAVTGRP